MTGTPDPPPGAVNEAGQSDHLDQDFIENPLRIRCADAIEIVTDFLDGALSEYDRDALIEHLDGCEACRVFVDQVEMTIRLSSELGKREVVLSPPDLERLVLLLKACADASPDGPIPTE